VSVANSVVFMLCAVVAIFGAVLTVVSRRPLRAAMSLLGNIVALAGVFLTAHAELLAAIQVLVYAGAVVVLFVFVIMLLGPAAETSHDARGKMIPMLSIVAMGTFGLTLTFAVITFDEPFSPLPDGYGTVEGIARSLYTEALLPFEIVSITLLVAVVGAVAVARGRSKHEALETAKKRAERDEKNRVREEEERRLSAEVSAHGGHG
jgi:NADH-quinone oxidoreductase subunit J